MNDPKSIYKIKLKTERGKREGRMQKNKDEKKK